MLSIVKNCDCMDFMSEFPDKYFDLSIVDPPYFEGVAKKNFYGNRVSNSGVTRLCSESKHWDNNIPGESYYDELCRVSKHQIIWGCNYFKFFQPSGRLVWDKGNDSSTFSNCELASIDLINSIKIFRYIWNGMLQQDMAHKEKRIHPTQKPVPLYIWTLSYAKPGDKILDTHLGSQSSRIAAHRMGFDFWGCEIDKEYFNDGCKRFETETSQLTMF